MKAKSIIAILAIFLAFLMIGCASFGEKDDDNDWYGLMKATSIFII